MEGNNRKKRRIQRTDKETLSRTLVLMAVCGIVAFLVLAIRLFYLQVVKHDYYEEIAVEQQTRESVVNAQRGTIYDRNGKVLAMSSSVETVFISPYEMQMYEEDPTLIARSLSEILDVDYESILEKTKDTSSWYKTIKTKIDDDLSAKVREFISENGIKSVHLEADTKRTYPYSTLACHIIGFVGTDNYGLEGIEAMYDEALQGENGRIVRLKNAAGTDMLLTDFEDYYDAENGDNLNLTIDVTIQSIVEKNLEQAINDYDIQNGAACIAMDPDTGEVLAMASYGNYDLNDYLSVNDEVQAILDEIEDPEEKSEAESEALLKQWRNKALSDTYEPGSVFKTITLAAALEAGVVSVDDTFYCSGKIEVVGREPVNCWKHSGHGTQTLAEAVKNSCNCAFVTIGQKLGAEAFWDYIEAFGFFDETGIDLSGEGSSQWWPKEVFVNPDNQSQAAATSFGQTFAITPIQMVTAMCAACNGGYLMQPYVVSSITDSEGNVVEVHEPTTVRQVVSEETSDIVKEILEFAVADGADSNAYVPGYRIAGKTGTSEKVSENLTSSEKNYVVSFCGFAPANDPQIVVLLLLDSPSSSTGIYISGGSMAAPPVARIITETLDYMGYTPEYTEEEEEMADTLMPDLTGWNRANAIGALDYQDLDYEFRGGGGTVVAQYPAAYSTVATGSKVILYTEDVPEEELVVVPDLSGMTYKEARDRLENSGLYISCSSGMTGSGDNLVVSTQSVEDGTETPYGSVIEVSIIDRDNIGDY